MSSNLSPNTTGQFNPSEMMDQAAYYALAKSKKPTSMVIGLAIMAGVFIGIAFIFYITVTTGNTQTGWGISRFAGGLAFSLGLILVVIGGGELFTSSVLSAIAVANKQISFGKMLGIWGKVYIGNFIGATLLLALVVSAGMYQNDGGQWGLNALNIAQHKLHHQPLEAFALGILCNLLVCLAVWLTFCSTNMLTKAIMVILPVAMFVSSGFEHCVANMFMVPLGIAIQQLSPPEFWLAVGASPEQYADLNIMTFITANLIPVTLGNIVGGAGLVGLGYWAIFSRPQLNAVPNSQITPLFTDSDIKEITEMNANKTVNQFMDINAYVLRPEMPVEVALDNLLDRHLSGAIVINSHNEVVGFFSEHDVLVELWCEDYLPEKGRTVADLMKTDITSISSKDTLLQLAEFYAIDKPTLYPTTDMGYATSYSTLSVNDRARDMRIAKPRVLPVIEDNKFVGIVTRGDVVSQLRSIYGERMEVVKTQEDEIEAVVA
jgi:formate transporter FocA